LTQIEHSTSEMDYAQLKTQKKIKVSVRKVNFPDWSWWPSWIYADYKSCLKLPSWQ